MTYLIADIREGKIMVNQLKASQADIEAFCQKWNVSEFSLFGSVLRPDFSDKSDIDILVDFAAGHRPTLDALLQMEDELAALFGRNVDLVERDQIEASTNYIRRKHILRSLEPVYVAKQIPELLKAARGK